MVAPVIRETKTLRQQEMQLTLLRQEAWSDKGRTPEEGEEVSTSRKPRITTVELIDIPPEHAGAMDVAWKRARQLAWGMPLWMLEAMRPMLVSIYMQGTIDGYGAAERERAKKPKSPQSK